MSLWQPPPISARAVLESEMAEQRAGKESVHFRADEASTPLHESMPRSGADPPGSRPTSEQAAATGQGARTKGMLPDQQLFSPEDLADEAVKQKAAEAAKYGKH